MDSGLDSQLAQLMHTKKKKNTAKIKQNNFTVFCLSNPNHHGYIPDPNPETAS